MEIKHSLTFAAVCTLDTIIATMFFSFGSQIGGAIFTGGAVLFFLLTFIVLIDRLAKYLKP
jgi:hypothetical protein